MLPPINRLQIRHFWPILTATLLQLLYSSHSCAQPLVDAAWLKLRLGNPAIAILDLRSGAGLDAKSFEKAHIPGSVFTDYRKDGWRIRTKDGVNGMMGPVDELERLLGRLGIGNNMHVILVANGNTSSDMGAATRVYWTFKMLGHDQVSILNGGFNAWSRDRDPRTKAILNPLRSGPAIIPAKSFKTKYSPSYLATREDVEKGPQTGTILIDNRSHDYYLGISKSSDTGAYGTIPGAKVLPESWLTINGSGHFRSRAEIERIYRAANLPTAGNQITFCNTGHLASIGWFVSHEILGNPNVRLYDGSMADWTNDKSRPVTRLVEIK